MPIVTQAGGGLGIFILALVLLLFRKKESRTAAILMFAGLTITYYLSDIIKDLVARPRPFLALADVKLIMKAKDFSFPSTHAMQAFMAACVLSNYFKRPVIFYSLAALVAVSRVCIGVHYPTDILAGALLGIVVGCILVKLAESFSTAQS